MRGSRPGRSWNEITLRLKFMKQLLLMILLGLAVTATAQSVAEKAGSLRGKYSESIAGGCRIY